MPRKSIKPPATAIAAPAGDRRARPAIASPAPATAETQRSVVPTLTDVGRRDRS